MLKNEKKTNKITKHFAKMKMKTNYKNYNYKL